MKQKNNPLLPLYATLFAAILLYSCSFIPPDGGGDQFKPKQTHILDVRVQPDTVAPGDTARFICVIEDSLDKRFKFYWVIDEGEVLNAKLWDSENSVYVTEDKDIKWVAPKQASFQTFGVLVSNGSRDSTSVEEGFVVVVE